MPRVIARTAIAYFFSEVKERMYLPNISHSKYTHDFAFWIVTSGDIVFPIALS
jgi:hypothetical protein